GPDPGAMGIYAGKAIAEDEYAYDITLRLAKELLSHGAKVYIIIQDPNDGIRDDFILEIDHDEVAYLDKTIPLNQVARLKQRVEIVNDLYKSNKGNYQRLIVTHVDSRSEGQNIDVFFYHHEHSKNGKRLAQSIHKTFEAKYKKYQPNRSYSGTFEDRTSLYLVKKTHPAMTFIEIGNIRNAKDQVRIVDPDNRQALAKWISEGVLLDYESE
ncbi:MAG: N-acetylmuramoyl-L-alanine amidase, partial [Maribacter dokdonensis]